MSEDMSGHKAFIVPIYEYNAMRDENARLKAEVERLTKAGDAIVDYLYSTPQTPTCHAYIMDWRNAKGGKHS